jgi:GGDEF domain-containing protein
MISVYLLDQKIEVQLWVSVGIGTCLEDATDLTSLLTTADRELSRMKEKIKDAMGRYGKKDNGSPDSLRLVQFQVSCVIRNLALQ